MANTKHDEEKWKIEEFAMKVLQRCSIFNGVKLIHAEKPDIQAEDKSWGIEVVAAVNPEVAEGQKTFEKKWKVPANTKNIRFNCNIQVGKNKEKLKAGKEIKIPYEEDKGCIRMTAVSTSYAVIFETLHQTIFQKLQKLQKGNYDGFDKVALFVFTEIPQNAKEYVLRFLQIQTFPIMFDYIFFCNSPHRTIDGKGVAEKLWFVKKSEI